MKIRPRFNAYVDATCFRNCYLFCILLVENPIAAALCIAGCYAVCEIEINTN